MKLKLFDYQLPQNLIAQTPAVPRDSSRLLVYDAKTKKIIHDRFYNLPQYLTNNDVLVFNNTKVFPARLIGNKASGGQAEILLLKKGQKGQWEAMVKCARPKIGLKLRFQCDLTAEIIKQCSNKTWFVKFNFSGYTLRAILSKIGQTPLPPYIKAINQKNKQTRKPNNKIKEQYQTVFALHTGSAAAPTAGLHFTKKLLNIIKNRGCGIEFVTLHVGLATFNPVNTENIEDYKIHSEWASVSKGTIQKLLIAKQEGKRMIAVGTTSTRVLETLFGSAALRPAMLRSTAMKNFNDYISTFIYPGYKFKFVDAIITNFHLPKSSLIMLVSAFIGRKNVIKIYKIAIRLKYRFFSFGDAMLLTKK